MEIMRLQNIIRCTYICAGVAILFSCTRTAGQQTDNTPTATSKTDSFRTSVLVTDMEADPADRYSARADELFDDFLYNYINDSCLRHERTIFPLTEILENGDERKIGEGEWHHDFGFMNKEYTTNLYNDEREKSINEDTTLVFASLEKIDLLGMSLTSFDFIKEKGKWNLKTIRHIPFDKSDLADFLYFYSRFTQDTIFNHASLARSIHISMMDPEDDEQTLDGFVTKDQWNTVNSGIPEGIITNIRYGQRYKHAKRILVEKISMGNGMSETFTFRKTNKRWELTGYEN